MNMAFLMAYPNCKKGLKMASGTLGVKLKICWKKQKNIWTLNSFCSAKCMMLIRGVLWWRGISFAGGVQSSWYSAYFELFMSFLCVGTRTDNLKGFLQVLACTHRHDSEGRGLLHVLGHSSADCHEEAYVTVGLLSLNLPSFFIQASDFLEDCVWSFEVRLTCQTELNFAVKFWIW